MAIPPKRPKHTDKAALVKSLKNIYDGFEVKDLTWDEFRNQMLELYDPKKMFDDLGDMELKKARERMNRIRIDNAIGAKK